MNNWLYDDQLQRIKIKLAEAKKADKDLKVFGADRHQYVINNPAVENEVIGFEERYSIKLPECYRSFILQIGNGGIGFCNSAAGPFYGIYPMGVNVDELAGDSVEKYLKNQCIIEPDMTDEFWNSMKEGKFRIEVLTDEEYETRSGRLYGGILPIGSQGCTYLHGIILNGPCTGRVVNLDLNGEKPHFAYEPNFLDWYERWLDEVISGELIKDDPVWFGYTKSDGNEHAYD